MADSVIPESLSDMLLRSTKHRRYRRSFDMRVIEAERLRYLYSKVPDGYQIESLPSWCNKVYKRGTVFFNPFLMQCSCEKFKENSSSYPARDINRICVHLYNYLKIKLLNELSPLTKLLAENIIKYGKSDLFLISGERPFYLGIKQGNEWINFFIQLNTTWARFSYSVREKRWSDNIAPDCAEEKLESLYVLIGETYR